VKVLYRAGQQTVIKRARDELRRLYGRWHIVVIYCCTGRWHTLETSQ